MKEDYLISIEKQMKAKELIERTSQTSIDSLKRLVNSYILVLLAVISIGGIGHILFKEVKRIVASAPCPTELQSTITGTVEIDASNYATDNVIDCSAVDITVANGGILRILPYVQDNSTTNDDFGIVLKANSFTVESGGTLDLEGQGYAAGVQASHVGSGKSSVDTCSAGECGGSGGGHGGAGGKGDADPTNGLEAGDPGESYGDEQNPLTLGSGGGTSSTGLVGGEGGGAIKVEVGCDTSGENCTGVFTNNGQITANGKIGTTDSTTGGGGGGGGSIWIESGTLSGSGILRADGGDGGSGGRVGGGGGGGLVAAKCWEANNASYTMSATGGTGGANDGQAGRIVGPSCYPTEPINLAQYERISYKPNTRNELSVGESTKKTIMEFEFNVGDIDDPEGLIPEIELIEDQETFSGNPTHAGSQITYEGTQVLTKVTATGITKAKEYKWRARVRDDDGLTSNWVQFGDNGEDADFTVLGNPAQIVYVSGDEQTGTVGEELAQPFVVELQDSAGHPYPGVTIGWDVKQGGGSVSSETTTTGDDFAGDPSNYGRAQTSLTLGIESGNLNNKVEAYRNGVNSVVFEATANPSVLHHYTIEVPSVALINTNFDPAVNISARDQYENLITTNNDTLNLSGVLAESGCPDTCNPGGGSVSPAQVTLTNGEIIISNLQYDAEEAIKIKAVQDGGSILGYSSTVNVVSAYGSCFGVANDPVNSPMTLTLAGSPWVFNASPSNGGVINCSNIDLTVESGAEVQLGSYDSGDDNWANDFGVTWLASSLDLQNSSLITAKGTGYGGNTGPGFPGSYGGYGGGGQIYGSLYEPTDLGSGGEGSLGIGGGAIRIDVSNVLTNNGTISADASTASTHYTVGGSGGSIWVNTNILAGDGTLSSNGGPAGWDGWPGGGAGGRIAIYYNTDNSSIISSLGTGSPKAYAYGNEDNRHGSGGPGTVYIEHVGVHPVQGGDLYVDNNGLNSKTAGLVESNYELNVLSLTRYGDLNVLGAGSFLKIANENSLQGDGICELKAYGTVELPDTITIDDLDLGIYGDLWSNSGGNDTSNMNITLGSTGGLKLYAGSWGTTQGNFTFNQVTINNGGKLILDSYDNEDTNYDNDYGINLNLNDLTIGTGGIITAKGTGYGGNTGPGFPGSYGGYGGGGQIYGSLYEPTDLGSGGEGSLGIGGGAIRIDVSNVLTNNGTISADASTTSTIKTVGGSGGSIWVNTNILAGDGTLSSNGGPAGWDGWPGGGAGGRIAIYYNTDNSSIISSLGTGSPKAYAYGNEDSRHGSGGPGTVYIEHVGVHPVQGGDLYVDNNGLNSKTAGLVESNYELNVLSLTRYGDLNVLGAGSFLKIANENSLQGDGICELKAYGTVELPDTITIDDLDLGIYGDLWSNSGGNDTSNMNITLGSTGGLKLYAGSWGTTQGNFTFNQVTINNGGKLILDSYDNEDTNYDNDYGINLNLNDLTIGTGGIITAKGTGYGGNTGPGFPGSYGGYGGGGQIYGSLYEPTDLGSGGEGSLGIGGGAIRIDVSNVLTNNGTISADASTTSTIKTVGGSGGSIWVNTNILAGDGTLSSNGGPAGWDGWPGGGAGGRIAIYYNTDNSSIISSLGTGSPKAYAYGNEDSRHGSGGPGTVYIEHVGAHPVQGGDLYVDNNIDTTQDMRV